MPRFSIIVPVYNKEKYITRCIESIMNQTYQDFEIIVINDGSTDNSENILLDISNKYKNKIKYLKQENQGIAKTRNIAVKQAIGEYFIFVDADDYVENTLLEDLEFIIKDKPVDIIKYKMNIISNNKKEKIDGPIFNEKSGEDAFNTLCFADKMIDTPCLYLFNTVFYKNNKFSFLPGTYHEDFGLIPIIILKANKVISINNYGYNYLQVEDSIIRNSNYTQTIKKAKDLLQHYDNMIENIKMMMIQNNTKKNIKQYYTNAILRAYKNIGRDFKGEYRDEIIKRKLLKNMQVKNIKQFIKKAMFIIGINIY